MARYVRRSNSGSLAIFAAIRRASLRVVVRRGETPAQPFRLS